MSETRDVMLFFSDASLKEQRMRCLSPRSMGDRIAASIAGCSTLSGDPMITTGGWSGSPKRAATADARAAFVPSKSMVLTARARR
jgi:hypothetical protein